MAGILWTIGYVVLVGLVSFFIYVSVCAQALRAEERQAAADRLVKAVREGRLADLTETLPTLGQLSVSPEMMEAAEGLVADADSLGIEHWRLQLLVRVIVYLGDRRTKTGTVSEALPGRADFPVREG